MICVSIVGKLKNSRKLRNETDKTHMLILFPIDYILISIEINCNWYFSFCYAKDKLQTTILECVLNLFLFVCNNAT